MSDKMTVAEALEKLREAIVLGFPARDSLNFSNYEHERAMAALAVLSGLAEENAQLKKDLDWANTQVEVWKLAGFKEAELKDGFKAENAALKAEVERLTELAATIELEEYAAKERLKVVSARAEKAEAALVNEQKRRAAVAESLQAHQDALAEARPLIEAAMSVAYPDNDGDYREGLEVAALAYREGREGKEPK